MNNEPKHITQQDLETIEQYMQGTMADTDRSAFEERIADDKELQQAVEYYAGLIEGIEAASLKSTLDTYHTEMEQSATDTEPSPVKNQNKNRSFVKYLIAASVVLLIGVIGWMVAFQQSPQEQLFTTHFEADPGLITPMSSTDQYDFYSGMVDYKRGNYQAAIAKWEPLLNEKPQSDTLNYFLGVAHLALGEQDEALPYLQTSVETSGSAFLNEAYYYLALANLKNKNKEAAMRALEQSGDERAATLLAELEENE